MFYDRDHEDMEAVKTAKATELAIQLHKDFRATFKAMHRGGLIHTSTAQGHDHGWAGCNRKDYFLQRAKRVLLSNAESA